MPAALPELSRLMAETIATTLPAVVRLRRTRFPASGTVWSSDGLVVTAAHVLGRRDRGTVELADGTEVEAKVLGRDPSTDLALLRIAAEPAVPPWADADSLALGHLALAVGRTPSGPTASWGVIGTLGGPWRTRAGGQITRHIDVDGSLPPGCSGGPLVVPGVGLVGLNTHALLRGGTTIPRETIERVVDQLARDGKVSRGYLGAGVQTVQLPAPGARNARMALLVTSVDADGPAAAGGLGVGDALLSIDGRGLERPDDLLAALAPLADAKVKFEIHRGGELTTIELTLGRRDL